MILVSGPVNIPTPPGVRRVDVESAADMLAAVLREVEGTDIFISTAAVADYRPARPADQKIKKTSDTLDLKYGAHHRRTGHGGGSPEPTFCGGLCRRDRIRRAECPAQAR